MQNLLSLILPSGTLRSDLIYGRNNSCECNKFFGTLKTVDVTYLSKNYRSGDWTYTGNIHYDMIFYYWIRFHCLLKTILLIHENFQYYDQ